jgi:hypothetical protein
MITKILCIPPDHSQTLVVEGTDLFIYQNDFTVRMGVSEIRDKSVKGPDSLDELIARVPLSWAIVTSKRSTDLADQ